MKNILFAIILVCWSFSAGVAQSIYGDAAKADVKVKYLNSYEEALKASARENKPIFFNCFADWAIPCHAMNKAVFSDAEFAKWLNDHFVCLCLDVSVPAHKDLVTKYQIRYFAHYLILDSKGNLLHRIVGGSKLPEFKEQVARGLNPERCLTGMTEKFRGGKRDIDFLRDYINVLDHADMKVHRDSVVQIYVAMLDPQELIKKENWSIFTSLLEDANSERFPFLLENYDAFVKENGKDIVDQYISVMYIRILYPFLFDDKGYEKFNIQKVEKKMHNYLAETDVAFVYLNLAKARGEKRYIDFIEQLKKDGNKLQSQILEGADMNLVTVTNQHLELKQAVEKYLNERIQQVDQATAKQYENALKQIVNAGNGVKFEDCTFSEVLAKARKENKPVFMDCFTVWCGPCKVLSNQIFPMKPVGDFFNSNFVNFKMDMERGEGIELAKRYGIKVYPTLLVLDSEGNLLHRFTGARPPRALIDEMARALSDSTAYGPVKAKYDAGDRTPQVVIEYLRNMVSAGDMQETEAIDEAEKYFNTLSEKERIDKDLIPFYTRFATEPESDMSRYFLRHQAEYQKLAGKTVIERALLNIYFPYFMNMLPEPNMNNEILVSVIEDIKHTRSVKKNSTLGYLVTITEAASQKDWEKVLKVYNKGVSQMDYKFGQLNLDMLWKRFWPLIPDSMKGRVVSYLEQEKNKARPLAVEKYTTLLDILK